jgi:hypothetical protein
LLGYAGATYRVVTLVSKKDVVVGIIVGGGAVTSFNVDSVPNSHVIGRHVIVPETGRHVEQVGGVAAQLVDHVFKRPEAGFMH